MIKELYKYLTTKTSKKAKKLGYLYSSIALEERFARCHVSWSSHVQNCHQFILENLPDKKSHIGIIGSGPLHEIPLDQILSLGHKITLIDVVHPSSVIKKYASHPNINFWEYDVTGFDQTLNEKKDVSTYLDFFPPSFPHKFDFVISANILSQLSINALDFLKNKNRIFSLPLHEEALNNKIGNDHWNLILNLSSSGILYSDTERQFISTDNKIIETRKSSFVTDKKSIKSWLWKISPLGEISKDYSMQMKVEGYKWKNI